LSKIGPGKVKDKDCVSDFQKTNADDVYEFLVYVSLFTKSLKIKFI
jgi:hypothetical protein